MTVPDTLSLYKAVLDILPTPVLIKGTDLRYVFINIAFEDLFQVDRKNIIGELDQDVFKHRQVVQCSSGDRRVFETGKIDESYETVFNKDSEEREVITRKNRLTMENGDVYLVGTLHDITDVSIINRQLVINQNKLKSQSKDLELMATTDPLTGCKNRRSLDVKLPNLFKKSHYSGGLIAIDIDHFKNVNDTYGHSVGDEVLKNMVAVLSDNIPENHELIRMGGEEFVIACPGESPKKMLKLANHLRKSIEEVDVSKNKGTLSITISVGVSHTQSLIEWNLDRLINLADKALYKAKDLGRNRVVSDLE